MGRQCYGNTTLFPIPRPTRRSMISIETNDAFYEKAETAFRTLFDAARARHELHFAMALMAEFRGMQDAGWNTAAETHRAFDEYFDFLEGMEPSRMKCRIGLSFYVHLSEASGFYEVPKNMLRIAGGDGHVIWPFRNLVQRHRDTGATIAPNANKVLKDLAGHAEELGMHDLAEVFRDAFDPDIRNGYAHADYVVWNDGLRLPMRNGGRARLIPWDDFNALLTRSINFFQLLRGLVNEYILTYNPPKTIESRMQPNAPLEKWTIYADPEAGAFGITNGKYPRQ